ncbi:hypothetical protein FJT64_004824 [Amphibalanus amphitrite]|uniref:Reverse transcriptase domain-containing protein n=1 Tax=Amphibalanus amphitrite TaxID=1232801 RepID=A0A6A4VVR0_AMPAM|nr:hypothetical protein FJT64_004824 [Amphibalanus amphitrite]
MSNRRFQERHTAANISWEHPELLEDFGLSGKVLVVVTDSAANMKKAFQTEALVVQDGLRSLPASVSRQVAKVNPLVASVKRSTVAAELHTATVTRWNSQLRTITVTRWNSQLRTATVPRWNSQLRTATVTRWNSQLRTATVTRWNSQLRTATVTRWNSQLHTANVTRWNSQLHTATVTRWNSQLRTATVTRWNSQLHTATVTRWNSQLRTVTSYLALKEATPEELGSAPSPPSPPRWWTRPDGRFWNNWWRPWERTAADHLERPISHWLREMARPDISQVELGRRLTHPVQKRHVVNSAKELNRDGLHLSEHGYHKVETAKRTEEIREAATAQAYKNLAELVLARLIMFNRRRQGEASSMAVDAYQKAISNTYGNPEVTSALTEFEKHLAGNLTRVVVRGKKGRGVPILLAHDMRASIDLLLKCRGEELSNLCSILGKDVESIVQASGEEPNSHPHIATREENFYVTSKQSSLPRPMDLREAILMLLWCVIILHQKHNKGAKKTAVYLESMESPDGVFTQRLINKMRSADATADEKKLCMEKTFAYRRQLVTEGPDPVETVSPEADVEERRVAPVTRSHPVMQNVPSVETADDAFQATDFSDLGAAVNRIAWLKRFVHNARSPETERQSGPLSPEERREALVYWIREAQRRAFPEELRARISPIGLVPKKSPGSFRVIHHLSFPAGESINDYIPRELTAVQYGSLDEAVEYISHFDHAFLAKSDIVQAFRLLPTTERDSALLGFRWRGLIYADRALPMGCASSAQIFQTFNDALVWIAQRHFGAGHIVAVLDDFLFIGASQSACASSLRGFTAMCHLLNVPLHPDKTVLPCQRLTFLGVELDVAERVLRLPTDKVERARDAVADLSRRRKAPLRQVQTCIGLLNFACLAVPLGRPFLRRLSDLCAGVRRPHHRVSLTRASRLDMSAWLLFLQHFNGRSLLDERRWTQAAAVCLETDASAGVFREVRPSADAEPTSWDWADFAMLQT